jgi:aspartate-semialdehyde dehydrogenase
LKDGMAAAVNGETVKNEVFAHPLPFNIIPHIDVFQSNGYTKEEMKVVWECRKILSDPALRVSCTAVRIPTLRAHAEAITLETEHPATPEEVREILNNSPGVKVVDEPGLKQYPMPLTASGQFDIEVGRIRRNDVFDDCGLDLFVCGDQLLRGAALNAVLIAEQLAL